MSDQCRYCLHKKNNNLAACLAEDCGKTKDWVSRKLLANLYELRNMLIEARIQIEYLHGRFQETGSGNAIIARIKGISEEYKKGSSGEEEQEIEQEIEVMIQGLLHSFPRCPNPVDECPFHDRDVSCEECLKENFSAEEVRAKYKALLEEQDGM